MVQERLRAVFYARVSTEEEKQLMLDNLIKRDMVT